MNAWFSHGAALSSAVGIHTPRSDSSTRCAALLCVSFRHPRARSPVFGCWFTEVLSRIKPKPRGLLDRPGEPENGFLTPGPGAQVAYKVATEGGRPSMPAGVPAKVRMLIISCWEQEPSVRLGMAAVVSELEKHDSERREKAVGRCKPGAEPDDRSRASDFKPLADALRRTADLDAETKRMAYRAAAQVRAQDLG